MPRESNGNRWVALASVNRRLFRKFKPDSFTLPLRPSAPFQQGLLVHSSVLEGPISYLVADVTYSVLSFCAGRAHCARS